MTKKWTTTRSGISPKRLASKRARAEAKVLAVRGSYDAPGFEACVKAEMSEPTESD